MKKNALVLFSAAAFFVAGCEAGVGDSCKTSNDCPIGTVCDTDSPDGYCLTSGCDFNEECPENSVCVAFTPKQHFCLKKCKENGDCRGGYQCREDIDGVKFCYVKNDFPYGRDENNEIEFVPPENTEY